MFKRVFDVSTLTASKNQDYSSDSDDESTSDAPIPVPKDFRCAEHLTSKSSGDALFIMDTAACEEVDDDEAKEDDKKESAVTFDPIDKKLQAVLAKAAIQPGYEKNYGEVVKTVGKRTARKLREAEREKTTGKAWFDMAKQEITDEKRRDLELLQMRNVMDPLAFYRKADRTTLPKYFQVGRVVDAAEDFYSGRLTKKERKGTMLDEMMVNEHFVNKNKDKFKRLREKEQKKVRGAFQGVHKNRSSKKKGSGGGRKKASAK